MTHHTLAERVAALEAAQRQDREAIRRLVAMLTAQDDENLVPSVLYVEDGARILAALSPAPAPETAPDDLARDGGAWCQCASGEPRWWLAPVGLSCKSCGRPVKPDPAPTTGEGAHSWMPGPGKARAFTPVVDTTDAESAIFNAAEAPLPDADCPALLRPLAEHRMQFQRAGVPWYIDLDTLSDYEDSACTFCHVFVKGARGDEWRGIVHAAECPTVQPEWNARALPAQPAAPDAGMAALLREAAYVIRVSGIVRYLNHDQAITEVGNLADRLEAAAGDAP